MRVSLPQSAVAVIVAVGLVCIFPADLRSQVPNARVDTLRLLPSDSILVLSSRPLQRSSMTVDMDGYGTLREGLDMRVDAVRGEVLILPSLRSRLTSHPNGVAVVVRFRVLPFELQEVYHTPSAGRILQSGRPLVPMPPSKTSSDAGEWFGRGLQRSGTIVRGLSVGTNRDASLTSGLRLQLSGSLADDMNVVAALTDENSPLQPEGTTQTLREVDRVFIEISGRSYGISLGDFVYSRTPGQGGAFGVLSRKFQGAQAHVRDVSISGGDLSSTVGVVGASTRGKFHTVRFQGSDGNQGPFRLTGKNGEPRVIVIAGSERVSINGEEMARGEVRDYVIDYAAGEVLFTSRRPITSASRIVVDFEYADRQYARNAIGASVDAVWRDSTIVINSAILQEADDPDAPLDAGLTDQLKETLRTSGADRFKASFSSVRHLGVDTVSGRGAGQYVRVDTVVMGRALTIYRFAPGDPEAFYAIAFSPVERMPTDSAGYERVSGGEYRFVGLGAGSYLPVQFIPIPQLQRTAHATVRVRPLGGVTLLADLAGSIFDQNRVSSIDDADRQGGARLLGVELSSGSMSIAGTDIGTATLNLSQRTVTSTFVSPDRLDPAEYERQWDLAGPRHVDERRQEATITYVPRPWIQTEGFAGTVKRMGETSSERTAGRVTLQDSTGGNVRGETERVIREQTALHTRSTWTRHRASSSMPLGAWRPGLRWSLEDRLDRFEPTDSLLEGSFKVVEWAPSVEWQPSQSLSGRAEVQWRREDSSFAGVRRHAVDAVTQSYGAEVRPAETVLSSLVINVRSTSFTEDFRKRGNGDAMTLLVRSHTRASTPGRSAEGDLLYEFSNQRSARLERVYVRVAKGTGNYRYRGDLNSNGLSEESEFELVRYDGDFVVLLLPGEALIPVNDVKASARIRWHGSRSIGSDGPSWLKAVSTETLIRIEERSTDPRTSNVYGLRWSSFLSSATTMAGQQIFRQDIHLFEGDPVFSLRATLVERRGLTQLVSAPERSYGNERSVRIRNRWSPDLNQQVDVWLRRDRMLSNGTNSRERDLTAVGGTLDMSMRLDRRWEAGWSIGVGSQSDQRAGSAVEAAMNEQSVRLIYGVPLLGQLRGEVRREESSLSSSTGRVPSTLPFELTEGKAIGRSWLWRFSGDVQLNSLIQLSVGYFGRQEGHSPAVHTARVEARAVF